MATDPLAPRPNLEFTIRKLQESMAAQAREIQTLKQAAESPTAAGLERLAMAISEQSARLEAMTRAVAHGRVAGGEDIPGPRLPRFYTVSIALESGSTATASGEAIITNDGPFKCYGIAGYYMPTGNTGEITAYTNRFLPVSTAQLVEGLAANGGTIGTAAQVGAALLTVVPDLSFQIQVAGSGRSWTPNVTAVPGGILFGPNQYNPLPEPALVAGGERIVVTVEPERAMPNSGNCIVVFQGYQILTNMSVRY